jgi:type IV pilus assembly protein PilM
MSNPITEFFSNLFASKQGDSVIGIDLGSAAIKVVQMKKKKGHAVLETYGELALGPYANTEVGRATRLDAATLVTAIKDLWSIKEVNLTSKISGLAIPMRSSMVSVLSLPTTNPRQLEQMVPLEARKYIPVPISEVAMDWSVIPKVFDGDDGESDKGKSEVLVVAIHNDTLSQFSQICKGAELNNGFYEIEMFGVMRALLDQGQIAPVLIVDMGAASTKSYIAEAGVVRESHIINRGSQDITLNISTSLGVSIDQAEQLKRNFGQNKPEEDKNIGDIAALVLDNIFSEINTVLISYQRKYMKNVGKVILTGGGSALGGITERAQSRLNIPTEIGNAFGKVQVPAFLTEMLKVQGSGFSVAVGMALRKLQEMQ